MSLNVNLAIMVIPVFNNVNLVINHVLNALKLHQIIVHNAIRVHFYKIIHVYQNVQAVTMEI